MGLKITDLQQSLIAVAALQLLPIQVHQTISRRAAILELLDGKTLEGVLQGQDVRNISTFQPFENLRRKAYMYGFISKELFLST
ncbi:hypothetical protein [Virgibacillus sp. DJP39]|uniref:hypothetical protein n=1 Tax=Virgibacillus sp. DJP39 TaxID=3409790 RepID=UPI003BB57281